MNHFTVCIPTYNRSGFLEKALGALLPQMAARASEGVGVYVSNNCSTDNTDEVVRKYQAQYPNLIQYKRQPHLVSPHMPDVLHSVKSKYVALMGDDDFVMPGYVGRILKCIADHPDVGLINYNVINYRDGRYLGIRDPLFCAGQGRFYSCGGEFAKEHHHVPSLMSSNVFLLENYLKAQDEIDYNAYPGYGWYAAMLKSVIHTPCYYIDSPLVWANCPVNVAWEKSALNVYMCGLGRLFKDLDADYSGLYESWLKVFETTWFKSQCLHLAMKYRDTTSREFYKDIIQYSFSSEYTKQLKICIFYPVALARLYMFYKNRLWPFIKRRFSISG